MPLIAIAVVPLLVRVAALGAPPFPTATDTQLIDEGDTEALPPVAAPVPVSATDCGILVAESVNDSLAVRVPAAVGLNTTEAVQLVAAARLVPHVLVEMVKSAALVPEIATLLIVTGVVRPLLNVADWALLADPTARLANVSDAGLAVTLPLAAVPVPDKATVCGLPVAESLKSSVAVLLPVVVGAKTMLAVQLADAARLVPHVLEKISKSPRSAPVSVMLLMVMAVVLPFVSVIAFCAPLPPTGTDTQFRAAGETVTAAKPATACSAHNATAVLSNPAFTGQ